MKKDNRVFLLHILEAIKNIEEYVQDTKSLEEFINSKITRDAVLRNFEVIGEAANNLEEALLTKSSHLGWEKIVGMRNFIIHEYFDVDLSVVWDTIKKDLPPFKKAIEVLLKKLNQ